MDIPEQNPPSLQFDEFPLPTAADWRQAVIESLGGKPFESLLASTYEGITLQPMYRRDDTAGYDAPHTLPGNAPFLRGSNVAGYLARPWAIAQELACTSPDEFNRVLRYDLAGGQTAVNLLLDGPSRDGKDPDAVESGEVGRDGVSLATVEDVAKAFDGVDLAATPLFIRTGTAALPLLALLVAFVRQTKRPVSDLHGCLEADPLGLLAHKGTLPLSLERAYDEMAHLTSWAALHAPRLLTIAVHAYPYQNAGANAVQELAFALATGVAYLRAMNRRGVDINVAARHMRFDFAVGGHFFMEIAKLRAARLLWAQVVDAFGGDDEAQKMRQHARTSQYNKTAVDPYTNLLRATTETLAAAIGGADSLHVAPFDEPVRATGQEKDTGSGDPGDDFARRIARNIQVILQEEAHLAALIDPAGGAYAIEAITDQLAREAWALFQETERQGGMAEALKDGRAQAQIAAIAAKRAANLATRRDVMVGANQFANPQEPPVAAGSPDYEAIYRRRVAQIEAYRAQSDDPAAHDAALERLGGMLAATPESIVESAITAAAAGATLGEITRALRANDSARPTVEPLPSIRAAEPFEALRRKADAYATAHGGRPRVFLANLGPPRQHKARADFAQGFFEVGGFQVITNHGFPDVETAGAAALQSGAPAVVICSTDETYPEIVPPLVKAIRNKARNTVIILAGRPADQLEAYKKAGVDEFIFFGADCVALNDWLLEVISKKRP